MTRVSLVCAGGPSESRLPAVCLSLSDELLQEQRADTDQLTASMSETPVDVRVSSEESDETLPFRPFHPFPSLPENEGVYAWGVWGGG